MKLTDNMVLKDKDGSMWILIEGSPGQYGMGVSWRAYSVTSVKGEFVVNRGKYTYVDTVDITRHNPLELKFHAYVKHRYFLDENATKDHLSQLEKETLKKIKDKLTEDELRILKEDWFFNGKI